MATIAEKMAVSLEELRKLQEQHPCVVLQGTKEIGRTHLTRLLDNGWLQEVMKGWYIAARPGAEGDTTVWYTAFWHFIAKYAAAKWEGRWCLTAEQSLDLYSGKTTVPTQVIIKSPNGSNNVQKLMYGATYRNSSIKNRNMGLTFIPLQKHWFMPLRDIFRRKRLLPAPAWPWFKIPLIY